ncbi:MAG: winged helix-turn-helix domain-containing protein [Phyllobacterium sp.]|uniref:winged helix-turn-helix domain-containing protein n=1 Tax=Phyllobacterium sp. TaxID=1871046 RepID=UPI0030F33ECB
MGSTSKTTLKTVFRIDFPNRERLGRGKVQLLELIATTGSISAAGRSMDMSYRRAWLLVSEMNSMFASPVVDSQRGGKQGGGATVTPFGQELLRHFHAMEAKIASAVADDIDWLEANRSKTPNAFENQ